MYVSLNCVYVKISPLKKMTDYFVSKKDVMATITTVLMEGPFDG